MATTINSFNRTKIVATMGPATDDIAVLEQMMLNGLDICRINFSHGDYTAVENTIKNIRTLNKKLNRHVGILGDLQGPKLRIGVIKDKVVQLENEKEIVITTQEMEGDASRVYITYPNFPKDVMVGETVLIDDGKIHLLVTSTNGKDEVRCTIKSGGPLS